MKRISGSVLVLFVLTALAFGAEGVKTAKVLEVKAHNNGRIAYWEKRVPIYDGYPLYDMTLLVGQKKYVVRYESMTGYYPSSWKAGSEIQVRLQSKGRMYVLNGAEEVPVEIVNARSQNCVVPAGPPVSMNGGSQVPCE